MRREEVIGKYLPIRQREDRESVPGEETQLRASSLKFAGVGGDDDIQALIRARSLRERESRGASIELPPLEAPLRARRNRWFQQ